LEHSGVRRPAMPFPLASCRTVRRFPARVFYKKRPGWARRHAPRR